MKKRTNLKGFDQINYNIYNAIRFTTEYESLLKVENEQKTLIEKLSNNDA